MSSDANPGPARFDATLGAWVLSRYADVAAALRDRRLSASGAVGDGPGVHVEVRDAAARALAPDRLAAWRARLAPSALSFTDDLPTGRPVDLVRDYAEPWSLALAVTATGAAPSDAERCARLARDVFLAAARATEAGSPPHAQAAAEELARSLPGGAGSADVQAFVALAQTLPSVLASVWLALLLHPDETARLRASPERMTQAVEELLRYAGPARAVFRQALSDVRIAGERIGAGERVVLLLAAANHDPERFPEPERLDLRRPAAGHLSFGRGAHGCPGAPMIRPAIAAATGALLAATDETEIVGEVEWTGGFAIRAPSSLPVVLRRGCVERDSPLASGTA